MEVIRPPNALPDELVLDSNKIDLIRKRSEISAGKLASGTKSIKVSQD